MNNTRVLSNPDSLAKIDFNAYRSQITDKAVVDQLEQAFKAVQVPYPKDDVSPQIDDQERRAAVEAEQYAKYSNEIIESAKEAVSQITLSVIITN